MHTGLFTQHTRDKLKYATHNRDVNKSPVLEQLLDRMMLAGQRSFQLNPTTLSITNIRNTLLMMDRHNQGNTKFKNDIQQMDQTTSFILTTGSVSINVHFLHDTSDMNTSYMGTVAHAISTFCNMFPGKYDDLSIYVSIDDNDRNLHYPEHLQEPSQKFDYLVQNSSSFVASGLTSLSSNVVILTKTEEIVKLLYHELCHYIGLDRLLLSNEISLTWDVRDKTVSTSEAYAEFISVILTTIYQAIQYSHIHRTDITETLYLFLSYEIGYSYQLTANMLYFYGYDGGNYVDFFRKVKHRHTNPIQIFSYVFLRTVLLQYYDDVLKLVGPALYVTGQNVRGVVDIMRNNHILSEKLGEYIINSRHYDNVSYILLNLDWPRIHFAR